MDIFDMREFDGHELIVFGHDAATSLRAIIAIHSTALGAAAGGCRMWPYATTAEAVSDVLRLSRGMSYKNGLAEGPLGGGKAGKGGERERASNAEQIEALCRIGAGRGRARRGRRRAGPVCAGRGAQCAVDPAAARAHHRRSC